MTGMALLRRRKPIEDGDSSAAYERQTGGDESRDGDHERPRHVGVSNSL
jgi:hypothetical protein